MNQVDDFENSIFKDKFPQALTSINERDFELNPSNHFGEASKRLQSLLFMIRDHEDVFTLFCANFSSFKPFENESFIETLVNFLYNDLTQPQGEAKLSLLI
jgi:hypothetical protein